MRLPAQATHQTFRIDEPLGTHWRDATCEEAECSLQANGFASILDPADPDHAYLIHHIRAVSKRPFVEDRPDGTPQLVRFTFAPGTECFTPHKLRVQRPELYVVRGGLGRATDPVEWRHSGPDGWVNHLHEQLDPVIKARFEEYGPNGNGA